MPGVRSRAKIIEDVVNPEWLSTVLSQQNGSIFVRDSEIVEVISHTWAKIRLRLEYDDAPQGFPNDICVKALLGENAAKFASIASTTEAHFYRVCAPLLSLNLPDCLYADPSSGAFIMSDLIASGAAFGTCLGPIGIGAVRSSLEQLASLHAQGTRLWTPGDLPWIRQFVDGIVARPIIPVELLDELLNGPRGNSLPNDLRQGTRLQSALRAMRDRFAVRPLTLIHGDAHAGNLYVLRGETGIVDWQLLHWGNWAQDIAYHIAAVLPTDVRRAHERELLDHYIGIVRNRGGAGPDPETAWDDYRCALVYGLYLWGVTRRVDPAITNEFFRRLGQAVVDHESFRLLGV